MAHADYNCCAICDRKLSYVGANVAKTKKYLCSECVKNLSKLGVETKNVKQFLEWARLNDKATILDILSKVGYRSCFYSNEFDETLKQIVSIKNKSC